LAPIHLPLVAFSGPSLTFYSSPRSCRFNTDCQGSPEHHRPEGPPLHRTTSPPPRRPASSVSSHPHKVARRIAHSVPILDTPELEHLVARVTVGRRAAARGDCPACALPRRLAWAVQAVMAIGLSQCRAAMGRIRPKHCS
jgi:hypothetical protein